MKNLFSKSVKSSIAISTFLVITYPFLSYCLTRPVSFSSSFSFAIHLSRFASLLFRIHRITYKIAGVPAQLTTIIDTQAPQYRVAATSTQIYSDTRLPTLYPSMNISLRVNFLVYPAADDVIHPSAMMYVMPYVWPASNRQVKSPSFWPHGVITMPIPPQRQFKGRLFRPLLQAWPLGYH